MGANAALALSHVSKSYGDFRAVDDISFDVHHGEIFAMLGPNGAGKSTTIRMILDIMKPDSGTIDVLGGPITMERLDRVGYLPEERGLYKNLKVIDVMTYLGTLKGLPSRKAKSQAMALLEKLSLAENATSKVSELSKGMQQKVQFAVTILHEPDLIIVDEPFSGLDPVNTLIIKDLIIEMKNKGTAVIMSTHQMHQVEEMADRLMMINRGQQALYGGVEDVRQQYAFHAVIVEGEGDWDNLDGVERVEAIDNDRKTAKMLHLHEDLTSNALLAQIASDSRWHVTRFEEAVPSLNDIFIQVAGERVLASGETVKVNGRKAKLDE